MKIDIRLEHGKPILFFTDCVEKSTGFIESYTRHDGHSMASRDYMYGLPKPETPDQFKACCKTLEDWARIPCE